MDTNNKKEMYFLSIKAVQKKSYEILTKLIEYTKYCTQEEK